MTENFLFDDFENLPTATSWCSDLLSNGGDMLAMAEKNLTLAEPEEVNLQSEFLEIDLLMKDVPAPFMMEMANDDDREVEAVADMVSSPVSEPQNPFLFDDLIALNGPDKAPKKKQIKKSKTIPVLKSVAKDVDSSILRVKPAQFCHVCWRSTKRVDVAICSNISRSACRKVICQKCFTRFGWDWESASSPNSNWTCTHCCGNCPSKAQCYVYGRTNERRRKQRAALKACNM